MAELESYRKKRDFSRTAEPEGHDGEATGDRYVMHKHAASHDHFDLRLEIDGVLKSWALPKGPSLDVGEKRLAVEVEDHPLNYGDFEGTIPRDQYGGGTVMLWDRGRWQAGKAPSDDRIDIVLEGEKLQGVWTLTRMKGRRNADGRQWLMIRRHARVPALDGRLEPSDVSVKTGRTMEDIAQGTPGMERAASLPPPPDPSEAKGAHAVKKMAAPALTLATLVDRVPRGKQWLFEIKFDGYRVAAHVKKPRGTARVEMITRNGQNWCERFPELGEQLAQLPVREVWLDGEVVALGRDGVSSFRALQEALSRGRTQSLVYQVFDLLYLDGMDLRDVALIERKRLLRELLLAGGFSLEGGHVRYCDHLEAQGEAFFERACQLGLEGIICKQSSAPYEGRRSDQWRKVKCQTRQEEFVVGGFSDPKGTRQGFGALLLGAFDEKGQLHYVGRVGTGFSDRVLASLHDRLSEQVVDTSPFVDAVRDERRVSWVRPQLVVDVEYSERTRDGLLRQPAYRGLRDDRNAEDIRLKATSETPSGAALEPERLSRRQTRKGVFIEGVRITHPERVVFPESGITKQALAQYYADMAPWLLPALANRPLSLLRCPEGWQHECFFQKHPHRAISRSVPRLPIEERGGESLYVYVQDAAQLVTLVQAGTVEFHPWGSRIEDLERPDTLIIDLDPSDGVAWARVLETARALREQLITLGLEPFVRTTGGKGLHLVVPLTPRVDWPTLLAFAEAVAERQVDQNPALLTTHMAKQQRHGRILLDIRRNERGATAVASYGVRAREGAPVAVPIRWEELNAALQGDRYNIGNLRRRLAALRQDPWAGFDTARRSITKAMLKSMEID